MIDVRIKVHEIATSGLPDMNDKALVGRVAFIWNGAIVSGWPLTSVGKTELWEAAEDAMGAKPYSGVTHWVEFPEPVWALEKVTMRVVGNSMTD